MEAAIIIGIIGLMVISVIFFGRQYRAKMEALARKKGWKIEWTPGANYRFSGRVDGHVWTLEPRSKDESSSLVFSFAIRADARPCAIVSQTARRAVNSRLAQMAIKLAAKTEAGEKLSLLQQPELRLSLPGFSEKFAATGDAETARRLLSEGVIQALRQWPHTEPPAIVVEPGQVEVTVSHGPGLDGRILALQALGAELMKAAGRA